MTYRKLLECFQQAEEWATALDRAKEQLSYWKRHSDLGSPRLSRNS